MGALFVDSLGLNSPSVCHCLSTRTALARTTDRAHQDKSDMEQPSNNALGAIRSGLSKSVSKPNHFPCPDTPKSRRGYAEGKNIHDLGKASRFSLLMSPENVSPRRVMKATKDLKNACLTPMLGGAGPRRNLYAGVTPPPSTGATPSSSSSSSNGHCEEVVRDDTKWKALKEHMRNRAKEGFTAIALGEHLNDLLDSASNNEARGSPPSPRQV